MSAIRRMSASLVVAALALGLAGCERVAEWIDAARPSGQSAQERPDTVAAMPVAPEEPAAAEPLVLMKLDPGQVAAAVRARRGAVRTVMDGRASRITVDAEKNDGAYIAFSVDGDLTDQLDGRRIQITLEASSVQSAVIEVQYHTLDAGGTPWQSIQLVPEPAGYVLEMEIPLEPAPRQTDEVRLRLVDPAEEFTLSGVLLLAL